MTRLFAGLLLVLAGCSSPELQLSPAQGRQSGGERLRIQGEGFAGHGPALVYVGNRAAKGVVIESDELLTLMTPQTDNPTTVDVRVEFQDGTVVELPQAFTYTEEKGIVLQPEIGFGKAGSS